MDRQTDTIFGILIILWKHVGTQRRLDAFRQKIGNVAAQKLTQVSLEGRSDVQGHGQQHAGVTHAQAQLVGFAVRKDGGSLHFAPPVLFSDLLHTL